MAQSLRAHTTVTEDMSSVPNTHIKHLTTTSNSRESNISGLLSNKESLVLVSREEQIQGKQQKT